MFCPVARTGAAVRSASLYHIIYIIYIGGQGEGALFSLSRYAALFAQREEKADAERERRGGRDKGIEVVAEQPDHAGGGNAAQRQKAERKLQDLHRIPLRRAGGLPPRPYLL